jgi:hypothetical protein
MGNTPPKSNNQSSNESSPRRLKSRRSFETTETTQTGGDIDQSQHTGSNNNNDNSNSDNNKSNNIADSAIGNSSPNMAKKKIGKKAATGRSPPNSPRGLAKRLVKKLSPKSQVERRDDVQQPPSIIKDDQIQVNLAMADLMAYLQVVANNSSKLPLSRRDDPELTASVSSLSSEEYARKSAAFIPADVRVIGGSFLKYGKVWDLPTSEEYVASDGAQEPGKKSEDQELETSVSQCLRASPHIAVNTS